MLRYEIYNIQSFFELSRHSFFFFSRIAFPSLISTCKFFAKVLRSDLRKSIAEQSSWKYRWTIFAKILRNSLRKSIAELSSRKHRGAVFARIIKSSKESSSLESDDTRDYLFNILVGQSRDQKIIFKSSIFAYNLASRSLCPGNFNPCFSSSDFLRTIRATIMCQNDIANMFDKIIVKFDILIVLQIRFRGIKIRGWKMYFPTNTVVRRSVFSKCWNFHRIPWISVKYGLQVSTQTSVE